MVVLQFKVKKDKQEYITARFDILVFHWAFVHNSVTYLLDIYLERSAANHYTV